jgi:hypothetical protein
MLMVGNHKVSGNLIVEERETERQRQRDRETEKQRNRERERESFRYDIKRKEGREMER